MLTLSCRSSLLCYSFIHTPCMADYHFTAPLVAFPDYLITHSIGQVGAAGLGIAARAPPQSGSANVRYTEATSKEWASYLLHLAHQKYNARDYPSAFAIRMSYCVGPPYTFSCSAGPLFTQPVTLAHSVAAGLYLLLSCTAQHVHLL